MNKLVLLLLSLVIAVDCYSEPSNNMWTQGLQAYLTHNHITPIMGLVDFSLPSTEKRFYVVNILTHRLLFETWAAHGKNSGGLYAVRFSNKIGSKESSLGTYEVKSVYLGKHGKSLKLVGLDSSNSNAYERLIEVHASNYIGYGKTKNSWGCFAVPFDSIGTVLKLLPPDSLIYAGD